MSSTRPNPELAVGYGIFSLKQASEAGFSRADVHRNLARDRWRQLERGILIASGRVERRTDKAVVAVLRAGPQAVASRTTAAQAFGWDLACRPAHLHVTVPPNQGRARADRGTVVHRSLGETNLVDGVLPVTGRCRTALDLAGTLPRDDAVIAVDSALRARAVRLEDLEQALRERGSWTRAAQAARVLALASPWAGSVAETRARLLFVDAGLQAPKEQYQFWFEALGEMWTDFAWQEVLLVVEIDGYEWHGGPEAFERDRARDVALVLAGWTVLRFTANQVRDEPAAVVVAVRHALTTRRVLAPVSCPTSALPSLASRHQRHQ